MSSAQAYPRQERRVARVGPQVLDERRGRQGLRRWGSFSRRITRPTHDLAEAWIREHADPGTVILLGKGWLELGETHLTTRRVPNLKTVLDGGVEQLGGCDWILIPEGLFGHSALRQLIFLHRFDADRSFGGNLGFNYEVYAVPEILTGTACGS